MVFVYRLETQLAELKRCAVSAKFGGATGNFNAHRVAYPSIDWKEFANKFVSEKLGLQREQYTTQISNYDNLAALFDAMRRINVIIMDMDIQKFSLRADFHKGGLFPRQQKQQAQAAAQEDQNRKKCDPKLCFHNQHPPHRNSLASIAKTLPKGKKKAEILSKNFLTLLSEPAKIVKPH